MSHRNFLASLRLALVIVLLGSSHAASAACSPHAGKVVVNEVYLPNSGTSFIELKIRDGSITPGAIGNWTIESYAGSVSNKATALVSQGTSNAGSCGTVSLWIRFTDAVLTNLAGGVPPFNFVLKDDQGRIVDIMRLGNNVTSFYTGSGSAPTNCALIENELPATGSSDTMYDAQKGSGSSIKDWYRTPDGTGPWAGKGTSNPGNSTCGSNDTTGGGTFGLAKVPSTTVVPTGSNFTYTLYAVNGGTAVTSPASVSITDTLPAGLTLVSCTTAQGTCATTGNSLTWTVGSVPANASYTATVTVTAASAGVKTNSITSNVGTSPYVTATAADVTVFDPPVNYILDEASWSSGATTSGSIINGTLQLGGASTAVATTGKICNGLLADFAIDSGISVSDTTGSVLDFASTGGTVSFWIKPTAGATTSRFLFAKQTAYFAYLNGSGNLVFGWKNGTTLTTVTSTTAVSAGIWTHVALAYDKANSKALLYLNGELNNSANQGSVPADDNISLLIGSSSTATLGALGLSSATYSGYKGVLDEFKIFKLTLVPANIFYIYLTEDAGRNYDGTTRTCGGTLHHLEITDSTSGSGLTCTPSTLTVKACANADCSSLYTGGVSGTLTASAGSPVWGGGSAAFAIASGGSSTTKTVQFPSPVTAILGISAPAPAPTSSTTCTFTSPANTCSYTAVDAALIFTATNSGNEATIPAQTAGVDFPATYYLRAVKTDKVTGACTAALTSSRNVSINYACDDPNSCSSGSYMKLGATSFSTTGTTTSLAFDANGYTTSALQFTYLDVGQIHLTASTTSDTGGVLSGSSNAFLVKPFGFSVIACTGATPCSTANSAASDGTGAVFAKAGQAFNATVRAIANGNTITPNFGLGTGKDSEHVRLTHTLVAPSGGQAGTLAGTGVNGSCTPVSQAGCLYRSAFSAGVANVTDLSWNEVGVITLTATHPTFQAASITASGSSGNIGRFQPDHFETAVTGPMSCGSLVFSPACPAGGLAYAGQPFQTDVTAYAVGGSSASATGKIANYVAPFARTLTLTAWDASGSTTTQNPGSGTLTSGTITYSAAQARTTSSSYAFGTALTAPTSAYLRAIDSDSPAVSSLRATPSDSVEGGIKIISGRLRLGSAFGSESLPLTLPAYLEYWNGTYWAKNSADSATALLTPTLLAASTDSLACFGSGTNCTTLDNFSTYTSTGASAITLKTLAVPSFPSGATATSGSLAIQLSAPGAGKTGTVKLSVKTPAWLQVGGIDAWANATFGVYNSNAARRFIYRRESY